MLSLAPPALHSLHSICSGGVSVSGGVLGLSLDVCMCQQGGEVSDRTRGKLFDFLKFVVHRALRVHTCGESCTGKGELHGVSALFSSWFSFRFLHDCVEPCLY